MEEAWFMVAAGRVSFWCWSSWGIHTCLRNQLIRPDGEVPILDDQGLIRCRRISRRRLTTRETGEGQRQQSSNPTLAMHREILQHSSSTQVVKPSQE